MEPTGKLRAPVEKDLAVCRGQWQFLRGQGGKGSTNPTNAPLRARGIRFSSNAQSSGGVHCWVWRPPLLLKLPVPSSPNSLAGSNPVIWKHPAPWATLALSCASSPTYCGEAASAPSQSSEASGQESPERGERGALLLGMKKIEVAAAERGGPGDSHASPTRPPVATATQARRPGMEGGGPLSEVRGGAWLQA